MTKDSGEPHYKIYVGNLAQVTTNNDLVNVFGRFGRVVEAIALASKGFGFVHMASEEDGVRAMKSLYKYLLNGKEMVVQPAINPKKASVAHSNRRATIGKGVHTLDDFEDFTDEFDNYLTRSQTESPESSHCSPTANFNNYSALSTNNPDTPVRSLQDNRNNEYSSASVQQRLFNDGYQSPGNVGNNYTGGNNGLQHSVTLPPGTSSTVLCSSSTWNNSIATKDTLLTAQNLTTQNNTTNNLNNINSTNFNSQAALPLNSLLASAQGVNEAALKYKAISQRLTQLEAAHQENGQNLSLLNDIRRCQIELQNCRYKLQGQTEPTEKSQLSQAQASYRKLAQLEAEGYMQQQQIRQLQSAANAFQNQTLIPPNSSMNVLPNNNLIAGNVSVNSAMTLPPLSHTNTINNMNTSTINNSNAVMTTVSTANALLAPSRVPTARCGACNMPYDTSQRVPKILGCTHTYCSSCLVMAVSSGNQVVCPSNCGVLTQLGAGGVSNLTTNQGVFMPVSNLASQRSTDVCAMCTGTSRDQPISKCIQEGHAIISKERAIGLMIEQIEPMVLETRDLMTKGMQLRSAIKDRLDCVLRALEKFSDELKLKQHRDLMEDNLLISTMNDFNTLVQNTNRESYHDLMKTYHTVNTCLKDAKYQYNRCLSAVYVNEAIQNCILQVRPEHVDNLAEFGIRQSESFRMDEDTVPGHLRVGNYATALLHYMLSDLMATRMSQSKEQLNVTETGNNNTNNNNTSTLENTLLEGGSVNSMSPALTNTNEVNDVENLLSNGVYKSFTASSTATPDLVAANGCAIDSLVNSIDQLDINYVLKTTAAIEAEASVNSMDCSQFADSTSLGLSNICHMVDSNLYNHTEELEKSLLEGSAIEGEPINGESSAPSPTSNVSRTPPMGNASGIVESSGASSDSGISCKPFSYLDAAKKPAKPQPEPQPKQLEVAKIPQQVKQIKTPHCWFKVTVDGAPIGRIVFQLRPDKAPKMCENFLGLCLGKPGYGYQGTHFFKNGDGFLAGGDVEFDDGTGGYSIFGKNKFEADLCPLKDEVGMIRFKGNGTSDGGRGMVGSQFMVWYAEREFKKFSYSLVFGRVVDGMDVVKKAANVNLSKHDVMIDECGGIM